METLNSQIEELSIEIRQMFNIDKVECYNDIQNLVKNIGGIIEYTNDFNKISKIRRISDKFIIYVRKDGMNLNEKYQENILIYDVLKGLSRAFLVSLYILDEDYFMSIDENDIIDGVVVPYKTRQFKPDSMHRFAQAILMPKDEYVTISNKHTEGSVIKMNKVAEYFNVNLNTAISRGQDLKILKYDF